MHSEICDVLVTAGITVIDVEDLAIAHGVFTRIDLAGAIPDLDPRQAFVVIDVFPGSYDYFLFFEYQLPFSVVRVCLDSVGHGGDQCEYFSEALHLFYCL